MVVKNRFRSFDFWDGAVFGATVATIFAIGLAWIFLGRNPDAPAVLATLTAIPTAFLAASIALWTTRFQLNYARSQDLASARVVLPLALTRMIDASNNALLLASGEHSSPPGSLEEARSLLSLDEQITQTIRDNVAVADPLTRAWLSVLVARYQVYFSRIDWWWSTPAPSINPAGQVELDPSREDALLDWATFYALVDHHYPYARSAVDQVPERLDVTRINSAFFHNIYHLEFTPKFKKRISIRTERLSDGDIRKFQFNE